nr:hypothetical protein Itr_chr09CG13210 [Ipomoea trifida]
MIPAGDWNLDMISAAAADENSLAAAAVPIKQRKSRSRSLQISRQIKKTTNLPAFPTDLTPSTPQPSPPPRLCPLPYRSHAVATDREDYRLRSRRNRLHPLVSVAAAIVFTPTSPPLPCRSYAITRQRKLPFVFPSQPSPPPRLCPLPYKISRRRHRCE